MQMVYLSNFQQKQKKSPKTYFGIIDYVYLTMAVSETRMHSWASAAHLANSSHSIWACLIP